MDPVLIGTIGLIVALALIAIRVPIAFALGSVAVGCLFVYFGMPVGRDPDFARAIRPTLSLSQGTLFELFHNYSLSAIPMFVALGHVSYRSGITSDIYFAARTWLTHVPGGLAMASVVGCGGFSAISGSSIACSATMGRVAVPEMLKYGYSEKLATGSVAAGGTLGSLIPPSILFIIYGIFAEQSISKLFLAGIIPGILTMIGYWIVIGIWTTIRSQDAPASTETYTMGDRTMALVRAWPAVLIFVIIVGGIYGGIFTTTEAAAVSFGAVTLIVFAARRIDLKSFGKALWETAMQTSVIFLIAGAAKVFVAFVSLTGVTGAMVDAIQAMDPSIPMLLLGIALIYVVMGMFLDPLGIMLLTLPFMLPLMDVYGLDLIWFGVIIVKLLEIGLITPPVGLNVFVLHSVTEPKVPLGRIFGGVMPFFAMDLVVLGLLLAFPILSLAIPAAL